MEWILVVPGALLPASLASSVGRSAQAQRLLCALGPARPGGDESCSEGCEGAAHWWWLGRCLGLPGDPPATAPYAWFADGPPAGPERAVWIAHADPAHMALARDHLVVTDTGDDALSEDETHELLGLANAAAAGHPGVRFVERGGRWFLFSDVPWAITTRSFDAAAGRPAQDHVPSGSDARRWRVLSNEIQMAWHASEANRAREARGARSVNALWLHGGGAWAPLPATPVGELRLEPDDAARDVLQGCLHAAAPPPEPARAVLASFDGLRRPRARQDWASWLDGLAGLEQRIGDELEAARRRGAARVSLLLCGERHVRRADFVLRSGLLAWRRRLGLERLSARGPETWLAEPEAETERVRA